MKVRASRSITTQVTLVFGVAISGALILAFALFYALLDGQLTRAQERGLQVRADYLAAAIRGGNQESVQRDPLAQYYRPDGSVEVTSTSLGNQRLLSGDEAKRLVVSGLTRKLNLETAGAAPVRLLSRPLGDGRGVLTVGVSADSVLKARTRMVQLILIAAPLLIAGVVLAGWRTVRAALAPVDRMTREAESISTLDSEARLSAMPGDDELARLARTLDKMLERLRVAFGRELSFVDDASHELRTPIAVMRGELELARAAATAGDVTGLDRALRAASIENERLARLAEDLLLLARQRSGTLVVRASQVDLLDLCYAEARRLGPVLGLNITVAGEPVVCRGDEDRLRQVLANLLQNARAAGATQAVVRCLDTGSRVELSVSDDGPGFSPAVITSVFDRFVRADDARGRAAGGAGLGLAIVRAIAGAHGGGVSAHNGPPLGGATVMLRLPHAKVRSQSV
ncbi:MAG TPA: ATP-binding protein [Sporichthyaceae bacterium]|nr:ATP-binding protein [Sporichthyaceae bacterium]